MSRPSFLLSSDDESEEMQRLFEKISKPRQTPSARSGNPKQAAKDDSSLSSDDSSVSLLLRAEKKASAVTIRTTGRGPPKDLPRSNLPPTRPPSKTTSNSQYFAKASNSDAFSIDGSFAAALMQGSIKDDFSIDESLEAALFDSFPDPHQQAPKEISPTNPKHAEPELVSPPSPPRGSGPHSSPIATGRDSPASVATENPDPDGQYARYFGDLDGPFEPEVPVEPIEANLVRAFGDNDAEPIPMIPDDHPGGMADPPEMAMEDDLSTINVEIEPEDDMERDLDIDERKPEIDPCYYAPPPYYPRADVIVHSFTVETHPVQQRRRTPVQEVFDAPVRHLWKNKFGAFNHLQSEMTNTMAYTDDNVVVSAPTGAGKTVIFEMAMARFFTTDLFTNPQRRPSGNTPFMSKSRKIVYVSPSKALCEERFEDWSKRLADMDLGIGIATVTGDGDPSDAFRDFASAHVVLTTPEKWDSLTRRWTENFVLFASVKLFMLDEVHLVADDSRGCCLESVVCRMKTIHRAARNCELSQADIDTSSYPFTTIDALKTPFRVVAVSATLPNIGEIAEFVDANEAHAFDETYRPVPLTTHVVGLGYVSEGSSGQFRFWNGLDREVPPLVHQFSQQKPTIVFCHSKAETERLADLLATCSSIATPGQDMAAIAGQTNVQKLQRVLMAGMAFHHAGLEHDDRRLIERAFITGKVRVLCATSTLAMGVNLPAHLVIVKGTKAWRGGSSGYQDLDQASLLQMMGRAGRPGFDTSGTAVIMTDSRSKAKFEKLATKGLDNARSQLLSKLDEIMNTEISQRVITTAESAINWIKGTLYFVQLSNESESVDEYILNLCRETVSRLLAIKAIRQPTDRDVVPRGASHVMSQHLVDISAMRLIVDLPHDASLGHVLKTLAKVEGAHRPVRRSEKRVLNETHKLVKFRLPGPPSKVRIQQPYEKVFVLLQASVGRLQVQDYAMRSEMGAMVDFSSRMLSAIEEYSIKATKNGQVALQAMKLRRALTKSLWNANDLILTQIGSLSIDTAMALKMNGVSTFDDVLATTSEALEKSASRQSPFGSNLRALASKVIQGSLALAADIEYDDGGATPSQLTCRISSRSTSDSTASANEELPAPITVPPIHFSLFAFTDQAGSCFLYRKNISTETTISVPCPKSFDTMTVCLLSNMIGLDGTVILKGSSRKTPLVRGALRVAERKDATAVASCKVTPPPKAPKRSMEPAVVTHLAPASHETETRGAVVYDDRATTFASVTAGATEVSKSYNPARYHDDFSQYSAPKLAHDDAFQRYPPRLDQDLGNTTESSGGIYTNYPVQPPCPYYGYSVNTPAPPVSASTTQRAPLTEERRGALQNTHSQTWRRDRRQQDKVQKRAFARKRDNPFSLFRHDPNNAEDLLDVLRDTTNAPASIIPDSALKNLPNKIIPHIPQTVPRSTKRRRECHRVSPEEVLYQKARELEDQALGHDDRWEVEHRYADAYSGAEQDHGIWYTPFAQTNTYTETNHTTFAESDDRPPHGRTSIFDQHRGYSSTVPERRYDQYFEDERADQWSQSPEARYGW